MSIRKLKWLSPMKLGLMTRAMICTGLPLTDIKSTLWKIHYSKENLLNDSIKFMH